MSVPPQAKYIKNKFNGHIAYSTFNTDDNIDTFVVRSENIALLVKDKSSSNKLMIQLVSEYKGQNFDVNFVSESADFTYYPSSKDRENINKAKKNLLELVFHPYDSIKQSFDDNNLIKENI